ncbi:alpha/beta fold hydrolase [Acinetobacter sp. ANC 4648]|uniref:alpha/beta fold hydrolase n=1 Tax=Acinetobacter sp. ANC 4648 TaxID=1977875 RepID=UPI000A338E0B|nr:alpha/beta hydrolase [Acinetobacter sp. ANC 4648]OTG85144.1 alpha/beta hydrolase [Acinetobacter sp. ANC 4648]
MNLIFLPGASGSTDYWQPVMHLLPARYTSTIIAYPSFGGYPINPDVQNFEDLQAYVLRKIQEPVIVIAQSMGGIFAVQAALQQPELIQGLVLVATSGGIDLNPFDVADWRQDYQLSFDVPDWFIQQHSLLDIHLTEIECPILLIWGDNDPISPVTIGQYLHSKWIQSELHIIENGHHDLANIHSNQVANLIRTFITKIEK